MKEFFKKVDFEKNQQTTENIKNFPGGEELHPIALRKEETEFLVIFYAWRLSQRVLTLSLLVASNLSSANYLCKHFGFRSGPTECDLSVLIWIQIT